MRQPVCIVALACASRTVKQDINSYLRRLYLLHLEDQAVNSEVEAEHFDPDLEAEDVYWALVGHLDSEDDCWGC